MDKTVEHALMSLGHKQESARLDGKSLITQEYYKEHDKAVQWAVASGFSDSAIRHFLELGREAARAQDRRGIRKWWQIFG